MEKQLKLLKEFFKVIDSFGKICNHIFRGFKICNVILVM
jgi:hypothetical protein